MIDPYILPNGTLRNKLGVTNSKRLEVLEANTSGQRLGRIEIEGPTRAFDFARLKETHRYIFQDIYEWAGQPPNHHDRKACV